MSKTFDFFNCSEAQRVCLVGFQLIDNAHRWWEQRKRVLESQNIEITWNVFKENFYEKFFPSTLRAEKAQEFVELKQGSMSVAQYEMQFSALLRFAPDTATNEEAKRQKFEDGLAAGIKARVRLFKCQTYGQTVDYAMLAEKELKETLCILGKRKDSPEKEEPSAKRREMQHNGQGSKFKGSKFKKGNKPRKKCDKCQRFHFGQCQFRRDACFKCGQTGHQARECTIGVVCYHCRGTGYFSRECESPSTSG